MAWNMREEK